MDWGENDFFWLFRTQNPALNLEQSLLRCSFGACGNASVVANRWWRSFLDRNSVPRLEAEYEHRVHKPLQPSFAQGDKARRILILARLIHRHSRDSLAGVV
jgi:hypothetical protein